MIVGGSEQAQTPELRPEASRMASNGKQDLRVSFTASLRVARFRLSHCEQAGPSGSLGAGQQLGVTAMVRRAARPPLAKHAQTRAPRKGAHACHALCLLPTSLCMSSRLRGPSPSPRRWWTAPPLAPRPRGALTFLWPRVTPRSPTGWHPQARPPQGAARSSRPRRPARQSRASSSRCAQKPARGCVRRRVPRQAAASMHAATFTHERGAQQ